MVNNMENPKKMRAELMSALAKVVTLFFVLATASQVGAQVSAVSQNSFLPEFEIIEFSDTFKAGSAGNAVIFRIENTTAFPVTGLNLRPQLPAQYLLLDRIEPNNVDLEPGEVVEITAEFSVREDAEVGARDEIGFHFDTESAYLLPASRYKLIAVIEAGELGAQCNSAVEAGGDSGGGVVVDLGGFVGLAGFSWEMYGIKDQMNVMVGGVQKTTGCVGGSGTFEINIPPGAATATVEVLPNCEPTSGTQWNFTFECPLSSDVTDDGAGNTFATADNVDGFSAQPGGLASTAVGAPVTPALTPAPAQGPTGVRVAEAEPNDAREQATPIGIGDQASGTIDRLGDGDNYTVQLSHQGELTASFTNIPTNINIAFRVLDDAGRLVRGWQTAPQFGGTYATWVDIKTPGTYVIEVRDGSNNAFSNDAYTMTTHFMPTADPAEPNDVVDTATPLVWNQAMASNILPLGDVDYFKVEAVRQGQITISFTSMPAALNMSFRVLDENSRLVKGWQAAPTFGESFNGIADIASPGTYIIEVRDGSNNARSALPYEMVASLNPTLDIAEPNNDITTATPTNFDAQVWASILPLSDADFYRVNTTHQGQITVDFNRIPSNLNIAFRVLDDQGRLVRNWQTAPAFGGVFSGWADIKTPGAYIVEVRDGSNNARAADPYGMVISYIPTADPSEPNDTLKTATPLAFNQPMRAAILPLGDVDHYLVTANQQGELMIDFASVPADLNPAFRVLDDQGRLVRNWQTAPAFGEVFSAWADLPSPGEYIVEIRDGSNNARAVEAYTMVARLTETLDPQEPNNAIDTATRITEAAGISASILPLSDVDFYVFAAKRQGELTVMFSEMPDELNMAFRVLSAQGSLVTNWQTAPAFGEGFTANADISAAGTYFLEVRDGSNNARSAASYVFSISMN